MRIKELELLLALKKNNHNKTFLAYLFLLFIVNESTLYGCSRCNQPLCRPWLCCTRLPFIFDVLASRVLTGCQISFISSCFSLLARTRLRALSLSPLSRSHQFSGRRIASSLPEDYPELWIFCNCSHPFHSLQPRRRVTDCWLRLSEWLLPNDCYKFS